MSNRLPQALGELVSSFPETHMGAQTVDVTLSDGTEYAQVTVAWGHEVVRVARYVVIPFDAVEVVFVRDASRG